MMGAAPVWTTDLGTYISFTYLGNLSLHNNKTNLHYLKLFLNVLAKNMRITIKYAELITSTPLWIFILFAQASWRLLTWKYLLNLDWHIFTVRDKKYYQIGVAQNQVGLEGMRTRTGVIRDSLESILWNYFCHSWTAVKLRQDFDALCEFSNICACY